MQSETDVACLKEQEPEKRAVSGKRKIRDIIELVPGSKPPPSARFPHLTQMCTPVYEYALSVLCDKEFPIEGVTLPQWMKYLDYRREPAPPCDEDAPYAEELRESFTLPLSYVRTAGGELVDVYVVMPYSMLKEIP